MTRRQFCGTALALSNTPLRLATFRLDATPPKGEPLIWTTPLTQVDDPLWAKGLVLESGGSRYVLCALDWCGLANDSHRRLRHAIARGARARAASLHSVHQHTAPYVDEGAYRLLEKLGRPVLRLSESYFNRLLLQASLAVSDAARRLEPFDRIGIGAATVERVASARRLIEPGGKLVTRFSTGGRDPALVAAPEGPIDPVLRTITFARGGTPLARLHFYATHPQTFCCDGHTSADFVGAARDRFEREERVPQIYFTGCAGDVTVGKYNDGSPEARAQLARRLQTAMESAAKSTAFEDAAPLEWRAAPLKLPPRKPNPPEDYRTAITAAFASRKTPLEVAALVAGPTRILLLPGEPMLEFQRFALDAGATAVAGYGDISPGYICTDQAFKEGGYEPGAANAGPGSEAALKQAIHRLLTYNAFRTRKTAPWRSRFRVGAPHREQNRDR